MRYLCAFCLTLGLLFNLCGCGGGDTPDLGRVQGRVTMDTKPVAHATVQFTPTGEKGGRPAVAKTDDDGEYELVYSPGNKGAVPGKYKVTISTYSANDDQTVPETVPAKYNVQTTLEKEVKPGSNDIDFELDSKGPVVQPGETGGSAKKARRNDGC